MFRLPIVQFAQVGGDYTIYGVSIRSHNRSRRPQERGPRGYIEKAKAVIFRTNCVTFNVTNSSGNPQICWNFRRWATVLRLYLSALSTLASAQ